MPVIWYAYIMKRFITLIAITFVVAILGVSSLAVIGFATAPQAPVVSAVEEVKPPTVAELLTLVNAERARVGVAPLVIDERLNQSAQFKSDDMLARDYVSHTDPATGEKNGINRGFQLTGHICVYIGENITLLRSENSSDRAVKNWVGSPKHYAAMINPEHSVTGFGISNGYITEHFCQLR